MITLERFEEIIKTIKQFDEDISKVSEIFIKGCTGFIDFHFAITDIIEELLNDIFDNEDKDLISWWLYENVDKIITWNNIKYDLTNIEDLYFWLKKDYNKIKIINVIENSSETSKPNN